MVNKTKWEMLKKNRDYKEIYSTGKKNANREMVIVYKKNNDEKNRLGISASKKFGNSVMRHCFKRRIKEIYRKNIENIKQGYDIIIIARNGSKEKNNRVIESEKLERAFFLLLKKIHD